MNPWGFIKDTNVLKNTNSCVIRPECLPVGVKVNDGTVGKENKIKSIIRTQIPTKSSRLHSHAGGFDPCRHLWTPAGGVGGGGVLSQLLVQILAQAVRRPAGQGSHTGEICVAISDTHVITRAAQLLTV